MANSKVLVKNDKVIVTEWSFEVGDSTGQHKHQYNYVVVPTQTPHWKVFVQNINKDWMRYDLTLSPPNYRQNVFFFRFRFVRNP